MEQWIHKVCGSPVEYDVHEIAGNRTAPYYHCSGDCGRNSNWYRGHPSDDPKNYVRVDA